MSNPPDDPQDCPGEHRLGIVLVCEMCDHVWEPSPEDRPGVTLACNQCGGATMLAELAEPLPAAARPR